MMIEDYVKENYPHIVEEYKRKTTPFYYEPGVLYYPITNGFGCGPEGSEEALMMGSGDYLKDGRIINIIMQSQRKPENRYCVESDTAYKKLKRVDESAPILGKHIPNSKKCIHMILNDVEFTIWQGYWRNHSNKTLGGSISVSRSDGQVSKTLSGDKREYYQLYSYFGSTWNLKHMKSWDWHTRENYDFKKNVSVRQFKEIVFGDPNVKIKCDLFGHL